MDAVDTTGDDGLPNWARTRGTLAGSQSDLPVWARGEGTDPSVSGSEETEVLPQWARRGLEDRKGEGGDIGDTLNQSSKGGALKQSSSGDILNLSSDGDAMKHPTPITGHPSDATVGDLLKVSSEGEAVKCPTPEGILHPVTGVTAGHPSDATVGSLLKVSSEGEAVKRPTPEGILHPVTGVTAGHPSDSTVGSLLKESDGGDIVKQSSRGDSVKDPTPGGISHPLSDGTLGHPSDAVVGDLLKASSDGDVTSQSCDTVKHSTPGNIPHSVSGVTLGHPSDAVVGDPLKQTSDGDNSGLSCDIVKHPAPEVTPLSYTGVVLGHPSDATAGDLLYPKGDTPDGQSQSQIADIPGTRGQASDVITSTPNHEQKVAASAIVQPATEVNKLASTDQDIIPASHMTHDLDAETKPVGAGDTDALSAVTRHYPRVGDESMPPVTKPGFFGHVSQLAGADYAISVPRSRFNAQMHATKESDWSDFTVRCNRRRHVVGRDVTTETQEVVTRRPHVKMNRWVSASTESEHVDASIARVKRFRELNDHHRHSSDSTVQMLLYGRTFGAAQDTQVIREGNNNIII